MLKQNTLWCYTVDTTVALVINKIIEKDKINGLLTLLKNHIYRDRKWEGQGSVFVGLYYVVSVKLIHWLLLSLVCKNNLSNETISSDPRFAPWFPVPIVRDFSVHVVFQKVVGGLFRGNDLAADVALEEVVLVLRSHIGSHLNLAGSFESTSANPHFHVQ